MAVDQALRLFEAFLEDAILQIGRNEMRYVPFAAVIHRPAAKGSLNLRTGKEMGTCGEFPH